jgi:hypothetical protein
MRLYQADLLQPQPASHYSLSPPIYLISQATIPHPPDTDAIAHVAPAPSGGDGEVMFVADYLPAPTAAYRSRRDNPWELPAPVAAATSPVRQVFFNGRWYSTGRVLLSAYCAAAIPILTLAGDYRQSWPPGAQIVYVEPGSPEIYRAWQQRWRPDFWHESIAREYEAAVPVLLPAMDGEEEDDLFVRRSVRTRPTPRPTPAVSGVSASVSSGGVSSGSSSVPAFVLEAMARDAVQRATPCPITMEPLTDPSQVAVTSCFHVFDATALAAWRASGENKCPTCRATI